MFPSPLGLITIFQPPLNYFVLFGIAFLFFFFTISAGKYHFLYLCCWPNILTHMSLSYKLNVVVDWVSWQNHHLSRQPFPGIPISDMDRCLLSHLTATFTCMVTAPYKAQVGIMVLPLTKHQFTAVYSITTDKFLHFFFLVTEISLSHISIPCMKTKSLIKTWDPTVFASICN